MHVNFYSGNPLDRLALQRDDEAHLAGLRQDPRSLLVPLWRDQHLIAGGEGEPRIAMPTRDALAGQADPLDEHPWVLLGSLDGRPVFALDLDRLDDPAALVPPDLGRFEPLRPLAPLLPAAEASILAQARGLLHWRRNHLFCGRCGHRTEPEQGGYRLSCPSCGLQHFPRTDPVVIMLVHHAGRALLARGTRFPTRRLFSALAGFIEPGESAEEAVRREVFEEVGLRLGRIRYHSSQSWPYPNSLMLGFLAEATGDDLVLDPQEITEAHWLAPGQFDELAALDIEIPGPTAIARSLIDAWRADPL